MTAQFQFFQSLPHKKADFVKKKPAEHGVPTMVIESKLSKNSELWVSNRFDHPETIVWAG